MNSIDQLKIKSLFKKFDYYCSELEWKEEVIFQTEKEFMEYTQSIIDSNEELKNMYEESIKEKYNKENEVINIEINEDDISHIDKDPRIKKLYRKVVKEIHPDKIEDERLNKIYVNTVEIYNNNDLLNMYRICDSLGIEYEIEIGEEYILKEIENIKNRISFVENNYIYKWVGIEDDKGKNEIVLKYIEQQL